MEYNGRSYTSIGNRNKQVCQSVQLSIYALARERIEAYNLNSNYITAYCNKREEQRAFRFDRIGQIEIRVFIKKER